MAKIKLVYESKRSGTRHLYGSETGIPADTDVQLTYTPAYNNQPYVYTKSATNGTRTIAVGASTRQVPATADVETTAKCGNVDVINNVEVNEPAQVVAPVVEAEAPEAEEIVEEKKSSKKK